MNYLERLIYQVLKLWEHSSNTIIIWNWRMYGWVFDDLECYHCLIRWLTYLCFTRHELFIVFIFYLILCSNQKKIIRMKLYRLFTTSKAIRDKAFVEKKIWSMSLMWLWLGWFSVAIYFINENKEPPYPKVDRRLVTSWLIFLGDSYISWKIKKQHTVSLSFTGIEYHFMAIIICKLRWLKEILSILELICTFHIHLSYDTQSILNIVKNSIFHEKSMILY